MNPNKWNIFLSLQGNDESSPPTDIKIIRPFNLTYKVITDSDSFNYFNLPEYKRILVIGAGDGAEVVCFKIRGYDVLGTTWHHGDKKFAKIHYKIDLIVEDMHNMKTIQSNSFDSIYSYHVLEHSIAPIIALYEMRRILRPNGKVLCILPKSGTNDETGLQHYSVLRNEHWNHLFNLMGFDNVQISSMNTGHLKDSISIKATKSYSRECPGTYFEKEIK